MPGVIKVLTAKDVKGSNNIPMQGPIARQRGTSVRSSRSSPTRRSAAAVTWWQWWRPTPRSIARAAAKEGQAEPGSAADLHDLPRRSCPTPSRSIPASPTGTWSNPSFKGEETADIFEEAPVVAEGSFYSQHEPHLTIEPDTLQGYWGTDGMMTLQCKSHDFGGTRDALSDACGNPKRTSE